MVTLKFDEINSLVGYRRSMTYEKFFGEMDLTKKQKQERITLAQRFEELFINAFILLLTMGEYGNIKWDVYQDYVRTGYIAVLGGILTVDAAVEEYVDTFVYETTKTARKNQNDPYTFSGDRAMFIAENESETIYETKEYNQAVKSGKKSKRWSAILDKKTRGSHVEANGQTQPIDEPFDVNGYMMMFPRDASLGADASEIVNCRCTAKYY